MATAVLLVTSTRAYADAREILRLQDLVSVLTRQGRAVDILTPRRAALLTAALPPAVRIFAVPRVPFMDTPPDRPSLRRFVTGSLMFLRAVSLLARRDYAVLHGIDDGALVVRAADRATVTRYPYIAEIHAPFSRWHTIKSLRRAFAQSLEQTALRHASAVVIPDAALLKPLGKGVPKSRLLVLPPPDTCADTVSPETFTPGDFARAIRDLYAYVTRDRRPE